MKMMKLITIVGILLIWALCSFAEEPILVGVLEQPQSCFEKKEISARVLFHKEGNKWNALGVSGSNKPSTHWEINSIRWTIAFDGKNLGTVQIEDPSINTKFINDWYYRRDKLHVINKASTPPKIDNKSKSFSGWCSTPDFRPLVILSMKNFKDPDMWKPFEPGDSYKQRLYPFLRVAIGRLNLVRCLQEPTYHSVPYDFKPLEAVLYKCYRSSKGKELISIGLDIQKINCDGPITPEWSRKGFLLNKENVDFIGREMELIGAGDYDNDGNSELLFWHSGYNQDGYILIYNDFRESAKYVWGYH